MKLTVELMKQILERSKEKLMKEYDAVDITVGLKETEGEITKQLCFKFWVRKKIPEAHILKEGRIPPTIEIINMLKQGRRDVILTDIKEEEYFEAHFIEEVTPHTGPGTDKSRPIKQGASNGNGGTGTTGFPYIKEGVIYQMDNAHVGAEDPFKYIGDQETKNYQPGKHHATQSDDTYFGDLRYMVLLNDQNAEEVNPQGMLVDGTYIQASYNTVDACLIKLREGVGVTPKTITGKYQPKKPFCIVEPGDEIGYTTWQVGGNTMGIVTDVGKSALVNYGEGKQALLKDLIVITKASGGGSSGSGAICLNKGDAAVGLNFAGSSNLNLICAIQHIDNAFGGRVYIEDEEPEPPNREHILNFELEREGNPDRYMLKGKVTCRGELIGGATIQPKGGAYAISDANGEYRIPDLAAGQYFVYCGKDEFKSQTKQIRIG